jgi:hypothetical protein
MKSPETWKKVQVRKGQLLNSGNLIAGIIEIEGRTYGQFTWRRLSKSQDFIIHSALYGVDNKPRLNVTEALLTQLYKDGFVMARNDLCGCDPAANASEDLHLSYSHRRERKM